jgi:hypothetical protein
MLLRASNDRLADSESEIRGAVRRMLRACEVNSPPTPIDRLLDYCKLTVEEQEILSADTLGRKIRRLSARFFSRFRHRILGILDLQDRLIVVDSQLHHRRREFIRYHEVGHEALPWHRELFVVTSEWDLARDVRERFEAEANFFAGHAIFQLDDMAAVQRGRQLAAEDLAGLASRYNASLTATARQYIVIQDIPAALLVGRPVVEGGGRGIRFLYGVANEAFLKEFGPELLGRGVGPEHPMSLVLNATGGGVAGAVLVVTDLRGESRRLVTETIFNRYNTLTLVHRARERGRLLGWIPRVSSPRRLIGTPS